MRKILIYIIIITIPIYSYSQTFEKKYTKGDTITLNGTCYISWNISFELNKAELYSKSPTSLLDSLVILLVTDTNLVVEVGVHRDAKGSEELYGRNITQERARSIIKYLINKGVNSKRLIAKGYGEERPLIINAKTEDEYRLNQRVEFRIIKKTQ